jgi:hypothetical protein
MSRIPLRTGTDVLLTMETRLNKRNSSARQGLLSLHAVSGDPFGCAGVQVAQGALRATPPDPVLPFTDPMQLVLHKVVYQMGGRSSPLIKIIPLGASGEDVAPTLNPMHGTPPFLTTSLPPFQPLASPRVCTAHQKCDGYMQAWHCHTLRLAARPSIARAAAAPQSSREARNRSRWVRGSSCTPRMAASTRSCRRRFVPRVGWRWPPDCFIARRQRTWRATASPRTHRPPRSESRALGAFADCLPPL